jgi:hypothetical protein
MHALVKTTLPRSQGRATRLVPGGWANGELAKCRTLPIRVALKPCWGSAVQWGWWFSGVHGRRRYAIVNGNIDLSAMRYFRFDEWEFVVLHPPFLFANDATCFVVAAAECITQRLLSTKQHRPVLVLTPQTKLTKA